MLVKSTVVETSFTLEELQILSKVQWHPYRDLDNVEFASPCHDVNSPFAEHDHNTQHVCYGFDYYRSTVSEKMCKVDWMHVEDALYSDADCDLLEFFCTL